jgi:hypothetical protein
MADAPRDDIDVGCRTVSLSSRCPPVAGDVSDDLAGPFGPAGIGSGDRAGMGTQDGEEGRPVATGGRAQGGGENLRICRPDRGTERLGE